MKANELVSNEFVKKLKKLEQTEPTNFKVQRTASWNYNKLSLLQREIRERKTTHPNYKQGSIVFVDFGINVGNEFSGPHFAIVLNKHDSDSSNLFTVLPLTSKKNKRNIQLETDIFEKVIYKQSENINKFSERLKELEDLTNEIEKLNKELSIFHYNSETKNTIVDKMKRVLKIMYSDDEFTIETEMEYMATKDHIVGNMISDLDAQYKQLNKDMSLCESVIEHYTKHAKSSYGIIGSITTISKDIIFIPINKFDPIGRISISKDEVKKISRAFNSKYI